MPGHNRRNRTFLGRLPLPERTFVADALRTETVGGMVLLAAAAVALVWANAPLGGAYESVRDFHFGIEALGLDLSVAHWTADGLLASLLLRLRNNKYRRLYEEENVDADADGVPDIYQQR